MTNETLLQCAHCARHIRASERQCPFCAAASPRPTDHSTTRALVAAAMLLGGGASLAACYGGPPHPDPDRPNAPQQRPAPSATQNSRALEAAPPQPSPAPTQPSPAPAQPAPTP